jgi:hypothetical protein
LIPQKKGNLSNTAGKLDYTEKRKSRAAIFTAGARVCSGLFIFFFVVGDIEAVSLEAKCCAAAANASLQGLLMALGAFS